MEELVLPAINFAVFIGVLGYFLRKPICDFVLNRHRSIKTQIEEAHTQKEVAQKKLEEFELKIRSFENEVKSIMARAKSDGEALKNKIIKSAQQTSVRMEQDAESTIAARAQEFCDEIRKETIQKAIQIAERKIKEQRSADDQRRILNEYVGKV